MGHLPFGGTKGFLAILALMALSSIRRPSFLGPRRAKALPGTFEPVEPSILDVAA